MKPPPQTGLIDAQDYAEYLRTPRGRLRADLAWENLRTVLPSPLGARALDIGGGTGEAAVRLAACGFQVTLLDTSESMLAEAERAATMAGVQQRITLVHGNATELSRLFAPAFFVVIVCHNLLEFVDRPAEILQGINSLLMPREDAMVSIIVRNRAGEVLSAALKDSDLAAAEANLTAPKVRAKLIDDPVSVFTPQELQDLLAMAKLKPLKQYGIRVFSDYLPDQFVNDPANYARLLALEQKLGTQPDFAAIARYTQTIASSVRTDSRASGQRQ